MSAALHLAGVDDIDRLLVLSGAFATEMGMPSDDEHRARALGPLLEGSPHGAVYLIGPKRAPVGYLVLSFGWSIEFGGLDAMLDELFIRPGVRGRGMASEVLQTIPKVLGEAGLRGLHLEVTTDDAATQRLYAKAGFKLRNGYHLMSRAL